MMQNTKQLFILQFCYVATNAFVGIPVRGLTAHIAELRRQASATRRSGKEGIAVSAQHFAVNGLYELLVHSDLSKNVIKG
jgi:hypothetical protein